MNAAPQLNDYWSSVAPVTFQTEQAANTFYGSLMQQSGARRLRMLEMKDELEDIPVELRNPNFDNSVQAIERCIERFRKAETTLVDTLNLELELVRARVRVEKSRMSAHRDIRRAVEGKDDVY